jgi:hypothetical protein
LISPATQTLKLPTSSVVEEKSRAVQWLPVDVWERLADGWADST